jgi:hypothetical protein
MSQDEPTAKPLDLDDDEIADRTAEPAARHPPAHNCW